MMKKIKFAFIFCLIFSFLSLSLFAQQNAKKNLKKKYPDRLTVDTRVDNMRYWKNMAKLGLTPVAPDLPVPKAVNTGSGINAKSVLVDDSPDIPLTEVNSTQSENSVFVNPNDKDHVLNSNNSTENPVGDLYGANDFYTTNGGESWEGEVEGAGGANSGDPTTAISLTGRMYVGYIHANSGQGVSYSNDGGQNWTAKLVANPPSGWGNMLDKNHLWIDNSTSSPYAGNLYDAWTNFGGTNNNEIEVSRTTDGGDTWSSAVNVSSAVNAGSHNQGVNLHTGPNGEVYAIWAIYDGWPTDESAIGFSKSLDGGATWQPATRIIGDIRGIRTSGTSKNMRVNSFPSMTVDISNGPNRGAIYVLWTNIGVPGINADGDIDVYMIKSTDQGATWSTPLKVNQDLPGQGKQHFFPWICCDDVSGYLSVIFYDDRNVSSSQCEVFVANSTDGGQTWEDFKVSDVAFTPEPISGLASSYFGDYLGITAHGRKVYPVWTDNRTGHAMSFTSPFETGPPPNQPWIVYQSNQINDITGGNGNGQMDYGETINLGISLMNLGDQPADNVTATISTSNPYITISDNQESFGSFNVPDTVFVPDAYTFTVAPNIPDEMKVDFDINVTDGDSTWTSKFTLTAHAPAIEIGTLSVSDPLGNNNNRLDPGETADIRIATTNSGDFDVLNIVGIISENSEYVTLNNTSFEHDTLTPGETANAIFNITVSEDAPVGTAVQFNYNVTAGLYSAAKSFVSNIGLILEDWETGDFTQFDWTSGGDAGWEVSNENIYEGAFSAISGTIADMGSSELNLQWECASNDSISFFCKVSSEPDYDFLTFYIDGVVIAQWSGEVDWTRVAYPISEGSHTLSWIYNKDVSQSNGSDAAWVDYIVLPPFTVPTVNAGEDASVCTGSNYILSGSGSDYTSIAWTTSGDGTFSDPTLLTPEYTPGTNDISNGLVILTLTGLGNMGNDVDNMALSIFTVPGMAETPIGETQICATTVSEIYTINSLPQAISYTWTLIPETAGTVTANNLQAEVFWNAGFTGQAQITVTGNNLCGSGTPSLPLEISVFPLPTATISGTTEICKGEPALLSIDFTGTAPWNFVMNTSTDTLTTETTPYTLEVTPESNSDFSVTSVLDAHLCSNSGTGIAQITVNPLPTVFLGNDTIMCIYHNHTLDAGAGFVTYSWSDGSTWQTIIVDSTNANLGANTFLVTITDNKGCQATDEIVVTMSNCEGIDEISAFASLKVYPNPNNGIFEISFKTVKQKQVDITITNPEGKVVFSEKSFSFTDKVNKTINLKNQSRGVYMLTLKCGTETLTQKLIIQ
ncbi:MAG: T9SS type A sorting domain-containing protein [Lentimicrobiaceae bacterium]|nr:T9SS type A sorting domain-containing protein [Lentimicrobiaceae bacterium]